MRLALFGDGGGALGAGHQVRLAAVAQAALAAGHQVVACCRDLPGSPHAWAWTGLPLHLLPATLTPGAALDRCPGEGVWIDHYGITAADLPSTRPTLMFDDVPGRDVSRAWLVVNPNLGVAVGEYPEGALIGPRFAPVRSAFAPAAWRAGGQEVVVMLGGTDHRGLTPRIVEVLRAACHPVTAIATALPPGTGAVVRSGVSAAELAHLLATCRAAVLGAGSAVAEALCVGTPLVAVHTADNQDRIVAGLRDGGLATVLTPDLAGDVATAVARALPPPAGVVDGIGPQRILAAWESRCRG